MNYKVKEYAQVAAVLVAWMGVVAAITYYLDAWG